MQYALTQMLPDVPAGGVCTGIDWATADHVACVAGMAGRVTDRLAPTGSARRSWRWCPGSAGIRR